MVTPVISVVSVKPLANYRLQVALSNGKVGVFDVSPYLDTGVFCELRDPDYFAKVRQFFIGVGWPNGQDISPGRIESEMQVSAKVSC